MHEIIKYVSLNIIKHKKISCGSNSIISSFENQDLTLRQIWKLNRMSLHYRELHGPKKNLLGAKGHWEVNDAIQVQFKLFFTICGLHVLNSRNNNCWEKMASPTTLGGHIRWAFFPSVKCKVGPKGKNESNVRFLMRQL